jgi:hypothetical protein
MLRKAGEASPKVVSSGYIFPTEKGEGKCFVRPTSRIREGLKTIEDLFDLMGKGVFLGAVACPGFCDYVDVCAGNWKDRWKALRKEGDTSARALEEIHDRE